MEWINILVTLIVGVLGGSLGGAFISWKLNIKTIKFNANYERKLNRYMNIIAFIKLYLHTEKIKYSLDGVNWDVRKVSIEENKSRVFDVLTINKRQLFFLTNNKEVINAYNEFLNDPNDFNYEALTLAMKKDLWVK